MKTFEISILTSLVASFNVDIRIKAETKEEAIKKLKDSDFYIADCTEAYPPECEDEYIQEAIADWDDERIAEELTEQEDA